MITDDLSDEDILVRLGAAFEAHPVGPPTIPPIEPSPEARAWAEMEVRQAAGEPRYRYIQPPTEQLESFIDFVRDPRPHFMLGLPEIDLRTRGYRPGELILVAGYSQGGKSQLLFTSMLHNTDKPILWITLDEPAEMVMSKLVAMVTRTGADKLEEAIKAGDKKTIDHVRGVVHERFTKLLIVDRQVGMTAIGDAVKEAEDFFGEPLAAGMLDYLGIVPSEEDREDGKAKQVKAFVSDQDCPWFVIHQNSRSGGGPGEPITLTSLAFGGDREATMIIGVRRKKLWKALDEWERKAHENTVSISIVKNKRPPAKLGEWDFGMDPETGLIVPRHAPTEAMQQSSYTARLGGGIDKRFGVQQEFANETDF